MNEKNTKIIIIVYLLYIVFSGFYYEFDSEKIYNFGFFLKLIFISHLDFSFFLFDTNFYINSFGSFNLLNILMYVFLLISLFFYILTKGKEKKLLLFTVSFLFISSCLNFFIFNIERVYNNTLFVNGSLAELIVIKILYLFKILIWFFIIKKLNTNNIFIENSNEDKNSNEVEFYIKNEKLSAREILNNTYVENKNYTNYIYKKTSLGLRFINYLFDTFLVFIILSNYFNYAFHSIKPFGDSIPTKVLFYELFGEDFMLFGIFFIYSILYYFITEFLFDKTPAKFLTDSIVLNSDCNKINASETFIRTICRKIPLEVFSFFGKNGLHDSLSKTNVFKVKNEGLKKRFSFIVILIFLILSTLFYKFKDDFENSIEEKIYANEVLKKKEYYNNKFNNISTNDFIVLNNEILKVEKSNGKTLEVVSININDVINTSISEYYKINKDTLTRFKIYKDSIINSLTFEQYNSLINLEVNKKPYQLEGIYDLEKPSFLLNYSNELKFLNIGKSVTITSIETDLINLENVAILPHLIKTKIYQDENFQDSFFIPFDNQYKNIFFIKFHTKDSSNNKYTIVYKRYSRNYYTIDVLP
jgi:hypothetical protein